MELSVATEAVAAWVRAEVVNTFTLTETLMSADARWCVTTSPTRR
jgi:hypothetical protein